MTLNTLGFEPMSPITQQPTLITVTIHIVHMLQELRLKSISWAKDPLSLQHIWTFLFTYDHSLYNPLCKVMTYVTLTQQIASPISRVYEIQDLLLLRPGRFQIAAT